MKTYRDLEIFKLSMNLFFRAHKLSMILPKYEMYELGSQLRRSSDSIVTNIVEGYGRSIYKAEFTKFLTYSYGSALETTNHLEKINHLYPELSDNFDKILQEYDILAAKIYRFREYVENNWKTRK